MDELYLALENMNVNGQSDSVASWSKAPSPADSIDLDLVDFRTMLEELEYK